MYSYGSMFQEAESGLFKDTKSSTLSNTSKTTTLRNITLDDAEKILFDSVPINGPGKKRGCSAHRMIFTSCLWMIIVFTKINIVPLAIIEPQT